MFACNYFCCCIACFVSVCLYLFCKLIGFILWEEIVNSFKQTERQLQFCTIEYLFSTIEYLFDLAQGFRMHGFFAWTGFMHDFKFQKIHTTCKWDLHDFKLKKNFIRLANEICSRWETNFTWLHDLSRSCYHESQRYFETWRYIRFNQRRYCFRLSLERLKEQ